jgi:hypothetical protein
MPQLPSGRHIAVDLQPAQDLFDTWHLDESREALARLSTTQDLLPLTRILELVPARAEDAPMVMLEGSIAPPPQMMTRDTGKRLGDFPDGFAEWSGEDQVAFREFVSTRVLPMLDAQLTNIRERNVLHQKAFIQLLEEAWRKAGVHPSQEPGWDDWPESPNIDVFDQLVALLQCRDAIVAAPPGMVAASNAVDRLHGFLSMATGALQWLPKRQLPDLPTAQLAKAVRDAVGDAAFDDERRDWWREQVWIECNNLFDEAALEPFLMAYAPKAYGVIKLAAITRPASAGA